MPLTEDQKKAYLVSKGLDPSQYDVEEAPPVNRWSPIDALVPPVSDVPQQPQQTSALGAFGSSAAQSIAPSTAALLGLRLGTKVPGGPIPKAIGGLVGALGAGGLASYGQGKLLQYVLPDSTQQTMGEQQQEHPIASLLGELAPMSLALGPGGSIGELGKIFTPARFSPGKLMQMGLGGVVQGGLEAGREYFGPEGKIDPARVAIATGVGGVLQNEPTSLGRKILGSRLAPNVVPEPFIPPVSSEVKKPIYKDVQDPVIAGDNLVDPAVQKLREELQAKEVKPSLETDQSKVIQEGQQPNRPQLDEEFTPDPTEKFYQKEQSQSNLTPEEIIKAKELAAARGTEDFKSASDIPHPEGGKAAGYYDINTNTPVVDLEKATSDTLPHEVAHKYVLDLRKSTRPEDVDFYTRGVKAAGSEEKLVQALGERYVETQNRPLRTWLQDARDYLFKTQGAEINQLARRFRDDKPFKESPELGAKINEVKDKLFSEVNSQGSSEKSEPSSGFLKAFEPVINRIAELGPTGQKAAKALENTAIDTERLTGQTTNKFIPAAKRIKDKLGASRYIWETAVLGEQKTPLNINDKKIIDEQLYPTYKNIHDIQRAEGLKVKLESGMLRDAIDNPNRRGPLSPSNDVIRTLLDKPDSDVRRKALIEQWVKHQMEFNPRVTTREQALEALNTYLRGIGPNSKSTTKFNALRKSEGFGIPFEWMEKDPVKLFERYGNRVSRDIAFFKNIENNPEQRAIWGIPDQEGNAPKVEGIEPIRGTAAKTALKRISGEHTTSETTYQAVERFVRSLILGPATGIRNTVQTVSQMLPYLEARDLPKVAEALGKIKQGFADSMEMGVNRHSITSLETGDRSDGFSKAIDNVNRLADIIRSASGANAIEQWTRAHNMALGEIMADSWWGRAMKGDIRAKAILRKFAPENVDFSAPLDDATRKEIAARFVTRIQGTYDIRGLPAFLLEPSSPAYWFMALSKWSVEKSNVIKQDVINPALKGDYGPLLRYTLGSLVTGEVVREISKELNGGKKSQTPDIAEIEAKGSASDWAFKATELAQLSGFAGIISDGARMVFSKIKGYNNQGFTIPSAEITSNITTNIANAVRAIQGGEPAIDVIKELVINITTGTVQAARMTYNELNPQEVDRLNKFRDKRVFDKLSGKNIEPYNGGNDEYATLEETKFKRAKDLGEAGKIYQEGIKPRLDTLDKTERRKEVQSLRKNNYQTVPAKPRERTEYLSYIEQTQGKSAARSLLEDKRKQDLINRRKRSIVR